MPGTIHFKLCNNQGNDLTVAVSDLYGETYRLVFQGPMNSGECIDVEIYADSSGRGKAYWEAYSGPNRRQDNINDGDTFNLG